MVRFEPEGQDTVKQGTGNEGRETEAVFVVGGDGGAFRIGEAPGLFDS